MSTASTRSASTSKDQDWAVRLEQEKRMTQQLAAKNEALSSQQQFVVERAADFALQQQERIANLEAQLGAAAPEVPGDAFSSSSRTTPPINVRHGCPRCATCSTLLQTVGQLEQMLQNRDSDCDMLRKALDDAQRVNALLLEQIDLLQRGLEKALISRSIPQNFQGPAPQLPLHHSVSPPSTHQNDNNNNIVNHFQQHHHHHNEDEPAPLFPHQQQQHHQQQQQQIASFNSPALPVNMRMLQPSSEPTLRAMADAVASLQNLWLGMSSSSPSSRPAPPRVPPSRLESTSSL